MKSRISSSFFSLVAFLLVPLLASAKAPFTQLPSKIGFPGGKTYLYRLSLTDKRGTPYSLDKPQEFLSQKAIERRKRQGLQVDSTDLPLPPAYLQRIGAVKGVEVVCKSKWNKTVVVRVSDPSYVTPLLSLSFVSDAQLVFTAPDSIKPSERTLFHKELEKWEGTDDEEYGKASQNIKMVNGHRLHQLGYKGNGVTIAVFDGGFMNVDRIPAMDKVKILGTRDFVAFKSPDIYQENDHGTKVLSAMALDIPGIFVGTAPDANYWLIRAEDTATESLAEEDYWTAAAEFADSLGVDIISSSLGYIRFDDTATNHKYTELDGTHAQISKTASRLASKGIVHVNSAGNEGLGTWKKIGFPADASDILAVGAVNPSKVNASFSSVGPAEDGRVKPDIMSLGSPAAVVSGRGAIVSDMGTSFAAPIISGMVACLWQSAPKATAYEVMDAIRRSGDIHETPNNVFGYGIPDFEKAYFILRNR
ncbi:MAG: S8 family serine peptidase [Prevotella sp.]|nr:S8 family serine peptidase [Prevotella sp.]